MVLPWSSRDQGWVGASYLPGPQPWDSGEAMGSSTVLPFTAGLAPTQSSSSSSPPGG